MKLALLGSPSTPKLFKALQIAYGLCGSWDRIIVLGSSPKDIQYQHMGVYNTLLTAIDAPPQRYTELLNLCGACNKEVIIFSTFSDQWSGGVMPHLQASYYEELLRSHRFFLHILRHFPRHVIACVETRKRLSYLDDQGPRLQFRELSVQQEGFERDFTSVLQVEKKGMMSVLKDLTRTLPENQSF